MKSYGRKRKGQSKEKKGKALGKVREVKDGRVSYVKEKRSKGKKGRKKLST